MQQKSNNDINAIKEVRKLFNNRKSNLSRKEKKEISKKLYKKEAIKRKLSIIFEKKKNKKMV